MNDCKITVCGRGVPPLNWFHNPSYLANRIYYICGGTAYYKKNFRLKPGYLYLFKADPDFEVSQDENDPVDHMFFDFMTYENAPAAGFTEIDISQRPALQYAVLSAAEYFNSGAVSHRISEAYFDIIKHGINEFFICGDDYSYITVDLLRHIHGDDIKSLSVISLSKAINADVNHVIRCFKRDMGVTPHKYIARLKADIAISELRSGASATELASKLGFTSVSALSTFFRNETHYKLSDFKNT